MAADEEGKRVVPETVYLSEELSSRVLEEARETGTSRSAVIRRHLARGLGVEEDTDRGYRTAPRPNPSRRW